MIGTDFLSKDNYIILPTKRNPKVYLSVTNKEKAKNAFLLYNPFSEKGKFLKFLVRFFMVNCSFLFQKISFEQNRENTHFITYLNNRLFATFTSSVYFATAKDKVVVQLQKNGSVFGYIKFPISELGKKRLLNEQKAIKVLSSVDLCPKSIFEDNFNGIPYLILQNLKGKIGDVEQKDYAPILTRFKKNKRFRLSDHPRIKKIRECLVKYNLLELVVLLDSLKKASIEKYVEVYEHGDFAAWNIIKTKEGHVPFDFEFFEETGLEYLDEIKFHFQNQYLLHGKRDFQLYNAVASKFRFAEFSIIFKIYLLKEIIIKKEEKKPCKIEYELLNFSTNEKA